MAFFSLGLNHHGAPLEVRERAVFNEADLPQAFTQIRSLKTVDEAVILSTCNRTEIFIDGQGPTAIELSQWLHEYFGASTDEFTPYLISHHETAAVEHLLQVCAGLDSMVLGEPQIFGQVKKAFAMGKTQGAVGPHLDALFQHVFAVVKQVRTETDIGANPVSVAYAAVHLSKRIFADIDKKSALLIGAGETIELVGRHLYKHGVRDFTIANRSIERAQPLAAELGAKIIPLADLSATLHRGDMVFSSTAAPGTLIDQNMVRSALKKRKNDPILLIDLAVPRDIEAQVGQFEDALLYSIDDLSGIIDAGRTSRELAAQEAKKIIQVQAQAVIAKLRANNARASIRLIRDRANSIQKAALTRSINKLAAGESAEKVLEELAHRITQKLMHHPTQTMSEAALKQDFEYLQFAKKMFGLQDSE